LMRCMRSQLAGVKGDLEDFTTSTRRTRRIAQNTA